MLKKEQVSMDGRRHTCNKMSIHVVEERIVILVKWLKYNGKGPGRQELEKVEWVYEDRRGAWIEHLTRQPGGFLGIEKKARGR